MRLLYSIFNLILIFGLINAYSYTSIQYEKGGCGGQIVTIQSSTLCSPLGKFQYTGNGTVLITYANQIQSAEDCEGKTPDANQTLTKCTNNQFKSYLNENDQVALAEGFCGTITTFNNSCSYLQLTSYTTGACEGYTNGTINSWYRYVCDGTTVQRFICTKDCSNADNLSSCTFEMNLPTIDACDIKVKSLDEITGDSLGGSSSSSTQLNISIFILFISIILSIL